MHKLISKTFCHFIKNKTKRKYIYNLLTNKINLPNQTPALKNTGGGIQNTGYHINGENNKIIIIENGIERPLRKDETIKGLNIIINGNNNTIKLELPIIAQNSKIEIGNDDVNIEIGTTNIFSNVYIRCCWGKGQNIKIGKKTTISGANFFLDECNGLTIGEDCKLSANINMWSTDGHAILNAETGEIINKSTGPVTIGNHCWIGHGVRITKNARIGNNCIVGGGAVAVKNYIEDNVIIAGNPAKIIKRGITWDRRNIYYLELAREKEQSQNEGNYA